MKDKQRIKAANYLFMYLFAFNTCIAYAHYLRKYSVTFVCTEDFFEHSEQDMSFSHQPLTTVNGQSAHGQSKIKSTALNVTLNFRHSSDSTHVKAVRGEMYHHSLFRLFFFYYSS